MNDTALPISILIVDDNATNLKVLHDYLAEQDYHLLVAEDGEAAIEQAQYSTPDLILLDVMMPGIDGFETCRRLKADEKTRDIPVIFMTALADTPFILKGFAVGAVDYLTKPLQQEEVNVRVLNHVRACRLQRALREEIEVRRQVEEELRQVNEGKDRFFNIIAHDLRGPMWGAISFSETMLEAARERNDAQLQEVAQIVHESSAAVGRLLVDLLAWSESQLSRIVTVPEKVDLAELLKLNVALAQITARQKEISLVNKVAAPLQVHADPRLIDTVARNLLANAIKFTKLGGTVSVSAKTDGREITVSVADSGVGIDPARIPGLFVAGHAASTRGTSGESGSGLGLPLCKEMAEKNGGRLWVESEPGKGSTFSFTVPIAVAAADGK